MNKLKIEQIALFGILLSIEIIFCFTPLGSLPALGPIVATLSCLPVIITALLLGKTLGSLMGFFFGLFSFLVWTFLTPMPLMAFIFTPFYSAGTFNGNFFSLVICFVPRILIGFFTALFYEKFKNEILASVLGSLSNTFFVLLGIFMFFGQEYSIINNNALLIVFGTTILTSGIPEAIIAGIVCPLVFNIINKIKNN